MSRTLIHTAAALVAVVTAMLLAGAVAQAADSSVVTARTAVVALDADPVCLNALLNECNQFVAHTAVTPALAGAFRARPDFTFEPVLVDRVDVQEQPFALTYHIKPEAVWSDGVPVSADDFLFTLETILDPANNTLRDGYQHVTGAAKIDPKTVTVQFSAPNPDWQNLFRFVLPQHVLAGHDFDAVWREEIADPVTHVPIGSGPFLVSGWVRGDAITLTRNARWWGGTPPFLDTIRLAIVPSQTDQLNGIRNGTIDLAFPQAQFGIADLRSEPGVVVESAPGTTMEHLDFHVASASMPLLREKWFRQAIAHSIDRVAIANGIYDTLVPSYPALQNLTLASADPAYEPVFARYDRDLAAVAALMLGHGCVPGGDGIWVCGGVRASVKLATTTGNLQRELVQHQLVAHAHEAGIELVPDNSPSGILFGTRLGARDYDSIMYAWVRLAGIPTLYDLYGCGGQRNFMGYCSSTVDALALAADGEADPAERARLANDANRVLAEDVPSLPLYLRIAFLVRREPLRGPQLNPGGFGTWNTEAWRLGSDETAPVTTASAAPAANANGWNDGPVTVELEAADDDSGVQDIRYTLTGAQTGGAVVVGSSAALTVSAEGITTIEYFATDASGNEEAPKTLTVRIDATAPTIVCTVDPESIWPPNGRLVPVEATVTVADALSGAEGFTLVGATSDEASSADVEGFVVGTADTSGLVRAERSARADGRVYTLAYEAADRAGNTATCEAEVHVRHHP